MKKHVLKNMDICFSNWICYCYIIYGDSAKISNHAECVHFLPTKLTQRNSAEIERITVNNHMDTAFTGSLQTYQLKQKSASIDFLEIFDQEKDQIENLIRKKTHDGPKKEVQLTTELKLVKAIVDQPSHETITIDTNSDFVPVCFLESRMTIFIVWLNNWLWLCMPLYCMVLDGFYWKQKLFW